MDAGLRERIAIRDLDAPAFTNIRLERRMAITVEVPVADFGQGIADLHVGSQAVLSYCFKSIAALDFRRGSCVIKNDEKINITKALVKSSQRN